MRSRTASRWLRTAGALGAALTLQACDRAPEPERTRDASAERGAAVRAANSAPLGASVSPPAKAEPRPLDAPFRYPAKARVVAIGDLHGDLRALKATLRLARAIDDRDRWIGKQLTVVQTGDQLDRGDQDRELLDFLEKLEQGAQDSGSELRVLNGNHELMNSSFDFRYVSPRGFAEFEEYGRVPGAAGIAALPELPAQARGRAAAFAPGGPYARKLARHDTVALIGDTLFVHGGVLPEHVAYGLGRINAEVRAFFEGQRPLPEALKGDEAPMWSRLYGSPELDERTCAVLAQVLSQVGARRMVIGHTVQKAGISSACAERVYRIDVGLSSFYGNTEPQVLELSGADVKVLKARPSREVSGTADSHASP